MRLMMLIFSKYFKASWKGHRATWHSGRCPCHGMSCEAPSTPDRSVTLRAGHRSGRDWGRGRTSGGRARVRVHEGLPRGSSDQTTPPPQTHTERRSTGRRDSTCAPAGDSFQPSPPQPGLAPGEPEARPAACPFPADLHRVDRGRRLLRGERAQTQRLHRHPRTAAQQHSASPRAPERRPKVPALRSPAGAQR